jgi:hypothetical protein
MHFGAHKFEALRVKKPEALAKTIDKSSLNPNLLKKK